MARGIFEQLDWLTKKYKQLCCKIDSCCNGGGTPIVAITRQALVDLRNTSTLVPGTIYKILDADVALYGGTVVFIKALTTNTLAKEGDGIFYNPKYDLYPVYNNLIEVEYTNWQYNYLPGPSEATIINTLISDQGDIGLYMGSNLIQYVSGDWSSGLINTVTINPSGLSFSITINVVPTYSINDWVIWGGKQWVSVDGTIGVPNDIFNLDPAHWTEVPFTSTEYYEVLDPITYDFDADRITSRKDKANNIVSVTADDIINYFYNNPIKSFQWGNEYDTNSNTGLSGNHIIDSEFECINFNGAGYIYDNTLTNYCQINSTLFYNEVASPNTAVQYNTLDNAFISNNVFYYAPFQYNQIDKSGIISNSFSYGSLEENIIQYSGLTENVIIGQQTRNNHFDRSSFRVNKLLETTFINNNLYKSNVMTNTAYANGGGTCRIEGNKLSNSDFNNNYLSNGCGIGNNILDHSPLQSNTLDNGSYIDENSISYSQMSSNTIYESGHALSNNVLTNASQIVSNNIIDGGKMIFNNLDASYISLNGVESSSTINFNTLQMSSSIAYNILGTCKIDYNKLTNSIFNFSPTGPFNSGLNIKKITARDLTGSYDLSSANYIYMEDVSKDILMDSDGLPVLLMYDSAWNGKFLNYYINA